MNKPTTKISAGTEEPKDCPICYDLLTTEPTTTYKCHPTHILHFKCAVQLVNQVTTSCPICRHPEAAPKEITDVPTTDKRYIRNVFAAYNRDNWIDTRSGLSLHHDQVPVFVSRQGLLTRLPITLQTRHVNGPILVIGFYPTAVLRIRHRTGTGIENIAIPSGHERHALLRNENGDATYSVQFETANPPDHLPLSEPSSGYQGEIPPPGFFKEHCINNVVRITRRIMTAAAPRTTQV